MTPETPTDLTPILGVSWPRSGHHLVQRMLSNYFGATFKYCEFYNTPPNLGDLDGCCKQVPCTHLGRIHFTKSHDFDGSTPQIAGLNYLIQYRDYAPSIISNFELFVQRGGEDSAMSFRVFASGKFTEYQDFIEKWVTSDFAKSNLVVEYSDLIKDPARVLTALAHLFEPGKIPDPSAIQKAVETVDGQEVRGEHLIMKPSAGVHAARRVEDFAYYSADLFELLGRLRIRRSDVFDAVRDILDREPVEEEVLELQTQPDIAELRACLKATSKHRLGIRPLRRLVRAVKAGFSKT